MADIFHLNTNDRSIKSKFTKKMHQIHPMVKLYMQHNLKGIFIWIISTQDTKIPILKYHLCVFFWIREAKLTDKDTQKNEKSFVLLLYFMHLEWMQCNEEQWIRWNGMSQILWLSLLTVVYACVPESVWYWVLYCR